MFVTNFCCDCLLCCYFSAAIWLINHHHAPAATRLTEPASISRVRNVFCQLKGSGLVVWMDGNHWSGIILAMHHRR